MKNDDLFSDAENSLDNLYNSLVVEEKDPVVNEESKTKDSFYEDSPSQGFSTYKSVFNTRRLSFSGLPFSSLRGTTLRSLSSSTPHPAPPDSVLTPKQDRSESDDAADTASKTSRHVSPVEATH